jgi:spore germination protein YaaH
MHQTHQKLLVSQTAGVIGDSSELSWYNSLKRDDFGRIIPKLSYSTPLHTYFKNNNLLTPNISSLLSDKDDISLISDLTSLFKDNLNNITNSTDSTQLYSAINKSVHTNYIIPDSNSSFENIKSTILSDITNRTNTIISDISNISPTPITQYSENFNDFYVYKPRSQRQEWIPVGLMGKINVRDNGLCIAGQKCTCLNGIAVPGNDWRVLSRGKLGSNVIRILYK